MMQRDITIGAIRPDEHAAALDVLVRGMHTNPINDAVAGNDPERSARSIRLLFGAGLRDLGWARHMLVARDSDDAIVGVCGMIPPGECQLTIRQKARIVPSLIGLGPRTLARVLVWTGAWAKRDTDTPHWHLGPVAVDPDLQGQGIGSALMRAFCDHVDVRGEAAWLETDKEINVRFYQRFGFEVAHEEDVLGVRNWFMLRPATPS
jgi:ribosomal protein S18 acetylase RimI-like enzyme